MLTFLTYFFVFVCVSLILLVLIQDPKGGSTGMFGGGGANSLFGATGAPTFVAKLTKNMAIIFGIMCIALTIALKPKDSSLLDKFQAPVAKPETQNTVPALDSSGTPGEQSNGPEAQKPVESGEKSSSNSK